MQLLWGAFGLFLSLPVPLLSKTLLDLWLSLCSWVISTLGK